jgi:hypothetical protein
LVLSPPTLTLAPLTITVPSDAIRNTHFRPVTSPSDHPVIERTTVTVQFCVKALTEHVITVFQPEIHDVTTASTHLSGLGMTVGPTTVPLTTPTVQHKHDTWVPPEEYQQPPLDATTHPTSPSPTVIMLVLNHKRNSETKPHFAYKSPFTDVLFLTMLSNFLQILCSKMKMTSRTVQTCS